MYTFHVFNVVHIHAVLKMRSKMCSQLAIPSVFACVCYSVKKKGKIDLLIRCYVNQVSIVPSVAINLGLLNSTMVTSRNALLFNLKINTNASLSKCAIML